MFSKAIEMFITELALRGWLHTEDAKRRTVQVLLVLIPTLLHSHTYTFAPQRSDIAMAITKHDMFDFLIDIVPREEIQVKTKVGSKVRTLSSDPPVFLECHLLDLSPGRGSLSHVSFPLVTRQRVFHMFPSLSSPGRGSFTCFLPSRHQAEVETMPLLSPELLQVYLQQLAQQHGGESGEGEEEEGEQGSASLNTTGLLQQVWLYQEPLACVILAPSLPKWLSSCK